MAISPELPDNTLTMAEKHSIPIDILSDTTSEVLKKYRLRTIPSAWSRRRSWPRFDESHDAALPEAFHLRLQLPEAPVSGGGLIEDATSVQHLPSGTGT